jgi:hypothetical protein
MRWTEQDLMAAKQRLYGDQAKPVTRSRLKYGNERVNLGYGIPFDSKKEHRQWLQLEQQRLAGLIQAVIRQVSLPLPNTKRRIRIDFLIVTNEGRFRFLDAKGYETPVSKLKRQQVLDAYGITIEVI